MKQKKFSKPKKAFEVKTFEHCLKECSTFKWKEGSPEPLASLEYEKELELKSEAFKKFLSVNGINKKAETLLASPLPRHYRTTTKRRVYSYQNGIGLGFSSEVKAGVVEESSLEPKVHQSCYSHLQKSLSLPNFMPLARALNWIIIRGTYERQFLILNFYKMNSGLARKLKQFCEQLQKEKIFDGAMYYFDPGRSEYYLEAERPEKGLQIKHLFGTKLLGLKVNDTLMRYSPTGFSQVNESMVPHMVDLAEKMLAPEPSDHLLDLYCGYGLFSHTLGQKCGKVTGIELSIDAINSAREISKRLKTSQKMRFYSDRIDSRLLRGKMEHPSKDELILLDPPRKGCEPGVISELSKRSPKRVLHIFCGTDVIPKEVQLWQQNGYQPVLIQAIDMFPGTANLETMILFTKA